MNFNITYQLLIYILCLSAAGGGKKTGIQLGFKKACVSCKKEVFYNFLTESGVLVKIICLIDVCVENAILKSGEANVLSHIFPTQKGLQ